MELLTAAQMRAIEQAAIDSGAVTGLELMERAGQGVVDAIFEEWPALEKTSHRAVVLCGPGNNGGDGFVVARLLKERGWAVEVFLYGVPEKLPPDARTNYARWRKMGEVWPHMDLIRRLEFPHVDADDPAIDLFVDAVFGTGLARSIPDGVAEIACRLNDREKPEYGKGRIVGVDIATGLCADSGRIIGQDTDAVFSCDLVVSFHSAKCGQILSHGPEVCGKTVVKDIGLAGGAFSKRGERHPHGEADGRGQAVPPDEVVNLVKRPSGHLGKSNGAHKYAHGHALILSGGTGRTGAARLAARGALRVGAGLVTLGVPGSAQMEVASQITALMLQRVQDGAGLTELLADERLNALCLGPGLGVERAKALVPAALGDGGGKRRPTVLDADALTAFAEAPETLFGMLHDQCVLTPHSGEFARLFPDFAAKLAEPAIMGPAYSKVDATREAAKRAGCVVLFKGPDTVIAAPDGQCSINAAVYDRAAPWLATAGSGDVLAGFITGLLARGFDPMRAAESAAWLHVEAARAFGPGLIADDLPDMLPHVFRDLGL